VLSVTGNLESVRRAFARPAEPRAPARDIEIHVHERLYGKRRPRRSRPRTWAKGDPPRAS
jgi:hypothetical protein